MLGVTTTGVLNARADVQLDSLLADNMVLQREKPIPVWGTAKPGERVTVRVSQQKQSAVTDADGTWKVMLNPLPIAQKVPFEVRGTNRIDLHNVAVGDVFICSGQSNMEFNVSGVNNAAREIAAADFPNVRLLTVPRAVKGTRQTSFVSPVQWDVCSPQTVPIFSAVGYFFGR